ncbi:MAG: DUF1156 domain-containing protein [Oscillospiraceae bacterium]|nr:DUF1156 domain-containing protein [Oscillospiraceae bacterium]
MANKKLIEVALPLDKINAAAEREKSIRHGHPSSLHLWWARRPLAAARAVIWSSLVDDPSSHPELFPTIESQSIERKRLFKILEDLVVWENSNNEEVINAAKTEILKSTNGNPPELLDPFAGGGAIPLEGQRLGLKVHAHDLNPIPVMINKALLEIPSRFYNMSPVNPDNRQTIVNSGYSKAIGLSKDVNYYGLLLKRIAFDKVGYMYPKVKIPKELGGGVTNVAAWIWTRTIKCPNPACGCQMPLVSSFELSKKKNNHAYIIPKYNKQLKVFEYTVKNDNGKVPEPAKVSKGKFKCIACGEIADADYIHEVFKKHESGKQLMAIVAEGKKGKIYITPDEAQISASIVSKPNDYPQQEMNTKTPDLVSGRGYGYSHWHQLFSNRQLCSTVAFCESLDEVQKIVENDAIDAGLCKDDIPLDEGGKGALAYSQAIRVYLAFLIDQLTNQSSEMCGWNSTNAQMRCVFARQAIPMVWDHAECNVFSDSSGSYSNLLDLMTKAFLNIGFETSGIAVQMDAQKDCGMRNIMVSTDPPYYDNISYADLSDYFYIWLRKNLQGIFPSVFSTLLVPKADELIASTSRFEGNGTDAKEYFENGMLQTCKNIYKYVSDDVPVTVYYAYKQSDNETTSNVKTSDGWETMLSSLIKAGFTITGTWPIRTEKVGRVIGNGTNALASSIVLVCRKRSADAGQITRRAFINALRNELRTSLIALQSSNIAPVDMAQSTIGPGMAVFSRYSKVLEADGSEMSVRSALQVINEELDLYFNEQVGDLDSMSRFCVDLYTQSAFNDIQFGQADVLARAKGTSVDAIASHGPVYAKGGKVHLIDRDQLPNKIDHNENCIWMFAQQLTQLMTTGGVDACAKAIYDMMGSNAEKAKDLAYRLYTIAEQKKWANEAYAYNALVVAWPDIQARAAELKAERPEQMNLFDY